MEEPGKEIHDSRSSLKWPTSNCLQSNHKSALNSSGDKFSGDYNAPWSKPSKRSRFDGGTDGYTLNVNHSENKMCVLNRLIKDKGRMTFHREKPGADLSFKDLCLEHLNFSSRCSWMPLSAKDSLLSGELKSCIICSLLCNDEIICLFPWLQNEDEVRGNQLLVSVIFFHDYLFYINSLNNLAEMHFYIHFSDSF